MSKEVTLTTLDVLRYSHSVVLDRREICQNVRVRAGLIVHDRLRQATEGYVGRRSLEKLKVSERPDYRPNAER